MSKLNVKISVVVPVYNCEKYILECLSSLQKQTFIGFEVIIINDGSTDCSQALIEKFIESDKRFKLVNKENKGVSEARNIGIALARGNWLCFIDADDVISHNYLENMYLLIQDNNDIDWVQTRDISEFKKSVYEVDIKWNISKVNQSSGFDKLFSQKNMFYIWGKLYRKEIILKNNLLFSSKLTVGEDLIFNIQFFCDSEEIAYTRNATYFYRQSSVSISRGFNKKYVLARIKSCEEIQKITKINQKNISKFYLNYGLLNSLKYVIRMRRWNYVKDILNYIDDKYITALNIVYVLGYKNKILYLLVYMAFKINNYSNRA
ncbi:glycosyltransferase family 2 protein [Pasteurella atlantica]|uniref:glycosyltransferase family 2 protein n=1 Tax=Pasteurellaceae TaxID=712 RepID=UPI0027529AFC|nr:glycosyltransferase family 2 protein [Pasteurella atlantica]MDP8032881.1 glycosyltransferase family 2 protein [Pasteurella atlantica]MDP8034962.1 glycosyltransferase family 2 protein [Pasteurella atlantica]MDP8036768.1 glycosyltransferase family 2 protein [Pasteurella atlantica]MDP8047259.1 glycosyltransferase family 2 protein [Pasteurella atlantica]MDP8049231.1 glycosyltransferase family 2 protein [Pasteurella atlantica]